MNRREYREAFHYVRYWRSQEASQYMPESAIDKCYLQAIERCPTGRTWRLANNSRHSMYVQFPHWRNHRIELLAQRRAT